MENGLKLNGVPLDQHPEQGLSEILGLEGSKNSKKRKKSPAQLKGRKKKPGRRKSRKYNKNKHIINKKQRRR